MKTEDVIYSIKMNIGQYENVILDVEYSAGDSDLDLEYECVRVSDENNFSKKQVSEIEEILESGMYEDVIFILEKLYKNSEINFIVN